MSKLCVVYAVLLVWGSVLAASHCRADEVEDEAAVREHAETYVEVYNKHDAKALAAMWAPEAVYMDPSTGKSAVGREEIEKAFAEVLRNLGDAKLEVEVTSVDFLSPNVAVENGIARVVHPDEEPVETNYTAVSIKRDGKWLLDRISEVEPPKPPPSNYERLKDLEWMIGTWIDQDEGATVRTDCSWTKNRNFITRSFAIVVGDQVDMAGMQIIGWDPVAQQIHSWVFDSDGGFGEAKWTRKEDRWLIRQTGTLPDGRKSSAVNIVTYIDDNTCTIQSIDRVVDGDMLPNIEEVPVVRVRGE